MIQQRQKCAARLGGDDKERKNCHAGVLEVESRVQPELLAAQEKCTRSRTLSISVALPHQQQIHRLISSILVAFEECGFHNARTW